MGLGLDLRFHHISIYISIAIYEKGERQIVRHACRFVKSEIGFLPPLRGCVFVLYSEGYLATDHIRDLSDSSSSS